MDSIGWCDVDWLDASTWPDRWQGMLIPMEFDVSCGGESHRIRWKPDEGAVAEAHGSADAVVAALGGDLPPCMRLAQFMGRDFVVDDVGPNNVPIAVTRWDARHLFSSPEEARQFAETLLGLDNPELVVVRGNKDKALTEIVRRSFVAWLDSVGLGLGEDIEVEVTVCSEFSGGGFGFMNRVVFDDSKWNTPLVGMQLCLGVGGKTRAVVCVSETWFDAVKTFGVTRSDRFFLGVNADGPVYSHLEVVPGEKGRSLVMGWGRLDSDPFPQDMEEIVSAATVPWEDPDGVLYVGSFRDWSDDGTHYRSQEGVHPYCVLACGRDARSWEIVNNFMSTFTKINEFNFYAPAEDIDFPEGFTFGVDDVAQLLRLAVRGGENPYWFVLPMAAVTAVKDFR